MNKEEVLEIIRSGAVQVAVRYIAQTGGVGAILSTKDRQLVSDEFFEALKKHQGDLAVLILENNVAVCPDPEAHRFSYRVNELGNMTCDACAQQRAEQVAHVPEDAPFQFDLREKKKNEDA